MLKIKTIALFLFVPLVVLGAKPQTTTELEIQRSPIEYVSLYASKYGAVESELIKVGKCESGFNPNAIHWNDGGKGKHSVGIFQYQRSTFDGFSKLIGEELDYYSYHDQAKLTAKIFAEYPKLKSHWTCSRITKII